MYTSCEDYPKNSENTDSTFEANEANPPRFYSLFSIITFFLLPPLWFLSIPALVFSKEAKTMYNLGQTDLYLRFSERARKFIVSVWAIFFIFLIAVLLLLLTIHLSLI